jgi:hypothetical protein
MEILKMLGVHMNNKYSTLKNNWKIKCLYTNWPHNLLV